MDPFVTTLRARRPDVDLVVLPPEPPPTVTPACDREQASAAVDRAVRFALRSLTGLVPRIAGWWDTGPGGVRPRRVLTADAASSGLLDGLATRLLADRWRVRRGRHAYDRLVADRDGVDLVATQAADGGTTLTVLGPRTVAPVRGER